MAKYERMTGILEPSVVTLKISTHGTVTACKDWSVCSDRLIAQALRRLAAYEDSGLSPEQVQELLQAYKDGETQRKIDRELAERILKTNRRYD